MTRLDASALPPRYRMRWQHPFEDSVRQRLHGGMTVLDVGSGRHPSLEPRDRPSGTRYVGLDISAGELAAAEPGDYDEVVAADVTKFVPELADAIDLAISWQVFEHVKPLDTAIGNLHAYLRPGGTLISLFSGAWSVFAVANRLIPDAIGSPLVDRVMRRRAAGRPVFPAYYDRCTASALREMTAPWSDTQIYPLYCAATYFHFSSALARAYLAYENTVRRAGFANLATHYLLIARK